MACALQFKIASQPQLWIEAIRVIRDRNPLAVASRAQAWIETPPSCRGRPGGSLSTPTRVQKSIKFCINFSKSID
jgi:hypothetical protein